MRNSAALSIELKRRFGDRLLWLDRIDPGARTIRGRWYDATKRTVDAALLLCASPIIAPVFFFCALLIKLDSPREPLFFAQQRTGRHGHRFTMYKFRAMVSDAEDLKARMLRLNERKWPDFRITHDPRVTRVGRLLRKTGLDELPQFLNVLRGDMSLVGPRPTSFLAGTYAMWQTERLEVPPGITGLWQIVGRDESEFDDRSRLDIAYIERRCLWLDIQIMVRTVVAAMSHLAPLSRARQSRFAAAIGYRIQGRAAACDASAGTRGGP
ncbi:MAG: sugar transferase [Gammaproteobacteria bacterium]